jgi:formylglycine-generating enzyme required for sulfatase activity
VEQRIIGWIVAVAASTLAVVACGTDMEIAGDGVDVAAVNPNGSDPGTPCASGDECKSGQCNAGACAPVGPGADCAGDPACQGAPACPADCANGCGEDGRCLTAPSCARKHGGRTCGPDGNDDCCAVAKQGEYTIDKYLVTAGRMRAFIERFQGNIKGFVDSLPQERWNPEWNDPEAIPTDMASANAMLGPAKKKACNQGSSTGHTYWTPKTDDDYSDFDQDVLDEKALNCVPWALLQALCAWDGGHLATVAELKAAFTNGGTTKYPWGDDELESVSRPDPLERLNIEGAFKTTPLPASYRKNGSGEPAEVSFLIAPPGRFPKGNNQVGIADAAGNLLEWVGDSPRQFVWKADFEHHGSNAAMFNGGYIWMDARRGSPIGVGYGAWVWGEGQLYGNAGTSNERNGYYSIGGRCAH